MGNVGGPVQGGMSVQVPNGAGEEPPKKGCLMPGIWFGVSALVTLAGLAYLGIAASGSESAGVAATWVVAGPLGLVWAGSLAGLIVHFAFRRGSTAVRAGVPLGCGCLGAITLFGLVLLFFAAIWPSL